MDITPLANLVKAEILYKKNFCLICQKETKEKIVQKPSVAVLENILEDKETVDQLGNLNGETAESLLLQGYSYHKRCREVEDMKRKRKRNINKLEATENSNVGCSPQKRRLTRSMLPEFDMDMCIICQEETTESTHRVSSDSRDKQIKHAFEISPRTLAPVKVRFEAAVDASAGDIRYHQNCWTKSVERAKSDYPQVSDELERELARESILRDVIDAAITELAKGNVLSVPNLVSAFQQRMDETDIVNKIERRQITRKIMAYFTEHEPNIAIEKSPIGNQGNRLVVKDHQKFALDIAVRAKREESSMEIDHLKHAAKIIRRNLLNYKNCNNVHFQGTVFHDKSNLPPILVTFLEQLIAGERSLNASRAKDVERDTCAIGNSLLYCMKSDRQLAYKPSVNDSSFYNKDPTLQQIGIGLAVHQATRDKQVINLLSGYKLSIPYQQIERLETAIGDCIIDKMNENNGNYIPLNFCKGIIPTFHIDNIDFSEDTPDGRSTTHALNCVAFQPRQLDVATKICLDLPKNPSNKCLKPNTFRVLKSCPKPSIKDFQHNKGFDIASTKCVPLPSIKTWVVAKAMEFLYSGHGNVFWKDIIRKRTCIHEEIESAASSNVSEAESDKHREVSADYAAVEPVFEGIGQSISTSNFTNEPINVSENAKGSSCNYSDESIIASESPDDSTPNHLGEPVIEQKTLEVSVEDCSTESDMLRRIEDLLSVTFDGLEIPSFGGINSITGREILESDLTNVATMPLIPGPASNFSAIYTAMTRAQGIVNWCCGVTGKTIISLDLDLYEKVYLLVNSRDDLRNRYILRLGELHTVFAMVRAIGTYLEGSGIDQAWLKSGWFSENTVKQVLGCSRMKRALHSHENTIVALYVIYMRSFLLEMAGDVLNDFEDMLSLITKLRSKNVEEIQMAFSKFQQLLSGPEMEHKLKSFDSKRQNNAEFKFLMTYIKMVEVLFKFIHASRSRDWLMHLSAIQEIIPYITSMDRIKYRRMLPVYLADMKRLEEEDPTIWNFLSDGNFCIQTTKVPATAKGNDHAG